jgi:hypothetical protein
MNCAVIYNLQLVSLEGGDTIEYLASDIEYLALDSKQQTWLIIFCAAAF